MGSFNGEKAEIQLIFDQIRKDGIVNIVLAEDETEKLEKTLNKYPEKPVVIINNFEE